MAGYSFSIHLPNVHWREPDFFAHWLSNGCSFELISNITIATLLLQISPSNRSLAEKTIQTLNRLSGDKGLSFLHILAIKGHNLALKMLIQSGFVILDIEDRMKFTPLHHAALVGNREGYELLRSAGASESVRNFRNGTPRDMLRLQGNFLPKPNQFGFICSPDTLYSKRVLLDDWAQPLTTTTFFGEEEMRAQYEQFKISPPKFELQRLTHDDAGNSLPAEVGVGVRCGQPIKKGTVCFAYGGQITQEGIDYDPTSEYRTSILQCETRGQYCADAKEVGSAGSRISDGFPKFITLPLCSVDGAPEIKLMIAICDLKPGELATHDYQAAHPVKEKHTELSPMEVRRWIRSFELNEFLPKLLALHQSREISPMLHLDAAADLGRLTYILNTPTTLIDLLAEELIAPDILRTIAGICGSQMQEISLHTLGPILYADKLTTAKDPSLKLRQVLFAKIQKQIITTRTRAGIQEAITLALRDIALT